MNKPSNSEIIYGGAIYNGFIMLLIDIVLIPLAVLGLFTYAGVWEF